MYIYINYLYNIIFNQDENIIEPKRELSDRLVFTVQHYPDGISY